MLVVKDLDLCHSHTSDHSVSVAHGSCAFWDDPIDALLTGRTSRVVAFPGKRR